MPLSLYFDNRTEPLLDQLIGFLVAPANDAEPEDPFSHDVLVTASLGLGRWLQQGIANRLTIASGIELQLPSRFLWQMMSRLFDDVSTDSPFDAEVVRWIIYPLLVDIAAQPDLEPQRLAVLHARLAVRPGDSPVASQELLVLATQIARQFAHLLNFRRDWLELWANDQRLEAARADAGFVRHEVWLSWLWRQTLARMPEVSARHPYDRFTEWMQRTDAQERSRRFLRTRVRRIAVFGVPPMSPEQVALFGQLSRSFEVTFFVPDPSRQFWQDLVSPRYLAEIRNSRPDVAWLYDHEPVVLGSWGRMQRDYLAQLRGLEESLQGATQVRVIEDFRDRESVPPVNRLQAVQRSLLELSDKPWHELANHQLAPRLADPPRLADHSRLADRFSLHYAAHDNDRSLEIHACHGKTRQLEVLRDLLLQAFDDMPDLKAEQVRVLAPDIEDFADAIDGVFGDGQIPYSIDGRRSQGDPLAQAFTALLRAAGAPVSSLVIRALLEEPAIASALEIDPAQASLLSDWLERAGFRYVTEDPAGKHDWPAAIERLWLGLCMSTEDNQMLPVQADRMAVPGLSATNIDQLGTLELLFSALTRLSTHDRNRPDILQWCSIAANEVEFWFASSSLSGARLALLDRLQMLGEQVSRARTDERQTLCQLGLNAFVRLLEETEPASQSAVRPGSGLSFASIDALASIPARVTAWLGLSDRAFPRQNTPLEFDLIQARPRFADLSSGIVDRGLFLEAIGLTSDRLIMLFDGRDIRSNEALNPSLLIQEMLSYVSSQENQAEFSVIEHPLMRFSPQVFMNPDRPGYDGAAFKAAQKLVEGEPSARGLESAPMTSRVASLDESQREWVAALAKPALAYLRHGLGIELPRSYLEVSGDPPLDPFDDLGSNFKQRAQSVLDLPLNESARLQIEAFWRLQPYLPQAAMGDLAVQRFQAMRDQRWSSTAERLQLDASATVRDYGLATRRIRWAGVTLETAMLDVERLMALDKRAQIVWTAFAEGAYAAIDTWMRHQVARLVYPGEPVVTFWFGEKSSWQIGDVPGRPNDDHRSSTTVPHQDAEIASEGSAESVLQQMIGWVQRIKSEPLSLFPKTYFAWVRARRAEGLDLNLSDALDHPKVQKITEQAFEREQQDRSHIAMYLRGVPPLPSVLKASDEVYRVMFENLR